MFIYFWNSFFPIQWQYFSRPEGGHPSQTQCASWLPQLGLSLHFCPAAPLAPGCTGAQGQATGQASTASTAPAWGNKGGMGLPTGAQRDSCLLSIPSDKVISLCSLPTIVWLCGYGLTGRWIKSNYISEQEGSQKSVRSGAEERMINDFFLVQHLSFL